MRSVLYCWQTYPRCPPVFLLLHMPYLLTVLSQCTGKAFPFSLVCRGALSLIFRQLPVLFLCVLWGTNKLFTALSFCPCGSSCWTAQFWCCRAVVLSLFLTEENPQWRRWSLRGVSWAAFSRGVFTVGTYINPNAGSILSWQNSVVLPACLVNTCEQLCVTSPIRAAGRGYSFLRVRWTLITFAVKLHYFTLLCWAGTERYLILMGCS